MPSHFSTIGLPLTSEDEFVALANQLAPLAGPIDVPGGRYLRWSSPSGAEVWLQLDQDGDLCGMNPHFRGDARVRVGLTAAVDRPEHTPFDGAWHGWADPPAGDPTSGAYPFVFDVPDFRCDSSVAVPCVAEAQVAAFAHEVTLYPSVEAYDSAQGQPAFASQSFIPSGLFSPDGETTAPPQAHAILTGHVRRAGERLNEVSGRTFYWAEVESYGGAFDVVIDPELIDRPPTAGGVVSGAFWLSGRLLSYPRRRGGPGSRRSGRGG